MDRIGAEVHVGITLPRRPRTRRGRGSETSAARGPVAAPVRFCVFALLAVGAIGTVAGVATSRVVVDGDSMRPTLEPGDRLLLVRLPPLPSWFRRSLVRPGWLVGAPDPRDRRRLLVKRVGSIGPGGTVELVGDNPLRSTDSRHFGPIDARSLRGVVVYRYAPSDRAGRLGAH
jgi:signal peptidase I